MKEAKKKDRRGKIMWTVVGSVFTMAGFIILPTLIKKYGSRVYKKSLNTNDIDFDEMGPEIVAFEEESKEEE